MVIVAGHITVEPQDESYLAGYVRTPGYGRGVRSGVRHRRHGPSSGRVRNDSAGQTLLRPMRSAPRSGPIERRQNPARRELRA